MIRALRHLLLSGMALASLPAASASFIDSDFFCRVFGCVIVHDGYTFDVYDNFDFTTPNAVPAGGEMVPRPGNPFQGSGTVTPVITGTLSEGFTGVPLQDQGTLLGIDTNGDGIADRLPIDSNNSGFLDAGDSFDAFELTSRTRLVGSSTSAMRSFYISASTDFYLTARASLVNPTPGMSAIERLRQISFAYSLTREGNDDGMAFGSAARRGNQFRTIGAVTHLDDIYGADVRLIEFRQPIAQRASDSLPAQSIRFDYVYGVDTYDLSMGEGEQGFEIEFKFSNR